MNNNLAMSYKKFLFTMNVKDCIFHRIKINNTHNKFLNTYKNSDQVLYLNRKIFFLSNY